jgi:hypothetical protein
LEMKTIHRATATLMLLSSMMTWAIAQDTASEDKTTVSFYGYVSYEAFFDSHRSVHTREGTLYLYPAEPIYHPITSELNNYNPQLEMLAMQSRLGARIAGPNVLGAKVSGLIEGDFLGTSEDYKHLLRLRHAMMKLQWEKTSILMGQFWHPMFTPELFPAVISFGAAAPYNPLNRAPQIRLDYTPNENIKLVLAALAHGQFASSGAEAAQRNAALPDLQFQLHIGNKPNFTTGITAGYMWLKPLETTGYYSEKVIGAYNLQWFGRYKVSKLTLQSKFSVGENMTQYVMTGGYGRLLSDDGLTYNFGYTNISTYAGWFEAYYKLNENLEIGALAGALGTLGSKEEIIDNGAFWSQRGAKIARAYRFTPRIVYTQKKVSFAIEHMYSTADWGATLDSYAIPQNITTTKNHRIGFYTKYSF